MNTFKNLASTAPPKENERDYITNITEYPARSIAGLRYARSTEEIIAVLHEARQQQLAVYPISTGRNWGLGSALPVKDHNLLLSLEHMNRIRTVNPRLRYAIVEPGLTQQALSDYLRQHHPQLVFPMTGSGTETSIVGNMIERGVSVRGHRYPYLLGLEVVLGNGKVIHTGHWEQFAEQKNPELVYAPGIGPDLNGLFTQSNLGIVSAMAIRLEKRQNRKLMSLIAAEENLAQLSDALFELREENVLQDGLLLTVYQDPRTSGGQHRERGQWFASASLSGSESMQEAAMLYVRQKLEPLAQSLRFYRSEQMPSNPEPAYLGTIARMYQGEPTNYALETMARLGGVELDGQFEIDQNPEIPGFVCALPVVPFEGGRIVQLVREVDRLSAEMNLKPYYNFVGLTPTALEGFFRVFFDRRDPRSIALAHQWNEAVHALLERMKLIPYRSNIEQMTALYTPQSQPYWQTVAALKSVLDPDGLIAPGRYCPDPNNLSRT